MSKHGEGPLPNVPPDVLGLSGYRRTQGQRRQTHLIALRGQPVELTNAPFVLLLDLVRACVETRTGYLGLSPGDEPEWFHLAIHRLRRQIDGFLGPGAGAKLVQTGVGCEYRLAISPDDIGFDPSFRELPRPIVPTDLRDFVIQKCRKVPFRQLAVSGLQHA